MVVRSNDTRWHYVMGYVSHIELRVHIFYYHIPWQKKFLYIERIGPMVLANCTTGTDYNRMAIETANVNGKKMLGGRGRALTNGSP